MIVCDTEQFGDLMLVNVRTDHAKTADNSSGTASDICFTGNIVEVDPVAVLTCYDTLGAEDDTVLNGVLKLCEARGDLILGEFLGGLTAEAFENIVCMMVVMLVVMMMLMIMTAAGAIRTMLVIVMLMMSMIVMMFIMSMAMVVIMFMMVMLMMVIAPAVTLVMVVMMFVMLVIMVLVVVMMTATTIAVVIMMMVMLMRQTLKLCLNGIFSFHRLKKLDTRELSPRRDYDGGGRIVLADQRDTLLDLGIGHAVGVTENNASGVFNLIVEKFTEVLHIHLALIGIYNGGKAIENGVTTVILDALYGTDDITELAYT